MPLKIRCPHCQRILVADDEVAGETRPCPECGQSFHVPLPRAAADAATHPASPSPKCPRCGAEVAATATHCHRCHTDLATGRPLPIMRRLRLMSWRFWAPFGFGLVAVALVTVVAIRLHQIYSQPPEQPAAPVRKPPLRLAYMARGLLTATDAAERAAALADLHVIEASASPHVAQALAASLDAGGSGAQTTRNRVAAIDLLARNAAAHPELRDEWLELLARCQQYPPLSDAALRARGVLGDAGALDGLVNAWCASLRSYLLLSRVVAEARADEEPGARLALRQARVELARIEDGLRALAEAPENQVFGKLAEHYWASWQWVGQKAGDQFAKRLFRLAQPGGPSMQLRPADIRAARDVMLTVADRGTPAARAAAGLVLAQEAAYYETARRRIATTLADLLPTCSAADQQRLTWTIARLLGRRFGSQTHAHPREVTATDVAAAQQWAHPGQPPKLHAHYEQPQVLVYRALTADRLLERDLLARLKGGWESADAALETWLAADLGCTPRICVLLDPGQRDPDHAALAAGMVIVAAAREQSMRRELELWHEARDQPTWIRALAYTVLGSLDAHRREWDSGWPEGLDLGDPAVLDSGRPGWADFGRVLAAGGPRAIERLRSFTPAPLSSLELRKLLSAAEDALER